jgi:hypothetical protein
MYKCKNTTVNINAYFNTLQKNFLLKFIIKGINKRKIKNLNCIKLYVIPQKKILQENNRELM